MTTAAPSVPFTHLAHLTDDRGVFEHALYAVPRREHGYCVDDAARGVVVLCREPVPAHALRRLLRCYLGLVSSAVDSSGRCHNRMGPDRRWQDEATTGDWWGRAVWALGSAATAAPSHVMRRRALSVFHRAVGARSAHRHAMAFAALGAAAVVRLDPDDTAARAVLHDSVATIGPVGQRPDWPWPEPRLRYGNAALAEALIVAGHAVGDAAALDRGLCMLNLLLRTEVRDGHLSVTPVGGRGPSDAVPGFDQQPIEVAALVDACASAYRVTSDPAWLDTVRLGWLWFLGANDSGAVMFDPETGGGYDGLEAGGRNANQGAESTLAMLSTAQQARRLL